MSTLWERVRSLEGRTLVTARGSPFVVDTVTGTAVIVSPRNERAPRFIRWRELEEAYLYGPIGAAQAPPPPPQEPGEHVEITGGVDGHDAVGADRRLEPGGRVEGQDPAVVHDRQPVA